MVTGVAKGILAFARLALEQNSMLLLLEAPAQHYLYNIGSKGQTIPDPWGESGLYQKHHHFGRRTVSGPCCQPTVVSELDNFRNRLLLKELHAQDPLWKELVGWLPFYDMSQMSYNNHVDTKSDCTHYMYQPYFYDPLYLALELEGGGQTRSHEKGGGSGSVMQRKLQWKNSEVG